MNGPIGVFDSGYGGLTVLREIRALLPQYDYLYLGDNARAPYGPRPFSLVLEFTWQAVERLFEMGCPLVILACNTASAKALRTIQQLRLPQWGDERRVLGVIRPTAECVGALTRSRHVGVVATEGTIASHTYEMEIAKLSPDITVTGQACPMWVPLVENGEADAPGADYFVAKYLDQLLANDPAIDTLILGCTHYPLLQDKIQRRLLAMGFDCGLSSGDSGSRRMTIVSQGRYVASSLADYLRRHDDMDGRLTRGSGCRFFTTGDAATFSSAASLFMGEGVKATQLILHS